MTRTQRRSGATSCAYALLLIGLLARPSSAQSIAITGVVVDASHAGIDAATVRAVTTDGQRAETTTHAGGRFVFPPMTPWPIVLDVSKPSFVPARVRVDASMASAGSLTVVLELAGVVERVDVAGSSGAPDSVATASKTETPILTLPQAVQVVTAEQLRDRRPVKLTDALGHVSGVTDGGSRRAFDFVSLRGFDASADVFLDGLRVERGQANLAQEVLGLEQVDVVKGPSAMLFGQGALGGVINQVSRRPIRSRVSTVDVTSGAFGFYQAHADLNGAVSTTTAARLTAIVRSEGDFVDRVGKSRVYVAPAFHWTPSARTDVTFLGGLTRDRGEGSYVGLPAEGTVLPNANGSIPRARNIREPDWDQLDVDRAQAGYLLSHRLADSLVLRQNLRYTDSDVLSQLTVALALFPDERTLLRGLGRFALRDRSLAVDTHLEAKGRTGAIEHVLLSGVDLFGQRIRQSFAFGLHAPLDLFAPEYGLPIAPLFPAGQDFSRRDTLVGLYVQDQMNLHPRVSVVAGGRFDRGATTNDDRVGSSRQSQPSSSAVPRLGGTVLLTPRVSAYMSFARSFNPTFGTTFDGALFRPERGRLYETGLKTDLADGRLTSTAALYTIARTNVLATDPDPNHAGFQIQTGKQRSRGLEIDVSSRLGRQLTIQLSYALTDARITEDTDAAGSRPQNIPMHQFGASGRYAVPRWRGLLAGGGIRVVGDREGTIPNTYRLPGYVVLDAFTSYRRGRLLLQANAGNLLDADYAASAATIGGIGVLMGERRTIRGTVGVTF